MFLAATFLQTYKETIDSLIPPITPIKVTANNSLLWPPCAADADIIFCPVVSFFFLFFSSPNLSGHRLDVYHTSTDDVALVPI